MHQLRFYKTSLHSKCVKMQQSKNLSLKSYYVLTHPSLNIEPFRPNIPYLAHSFIKLNNFCNVKQFWCLFLKGKKFKDIFLLILFTSLFFQKEKWCVKFQVLSSMVMVDLNKNEGWLEVFFLPSFLVATYSMYFTLITWTHTCWMFFWTSHMIIIFLKKIKDLFIFFQF